MANCTVGTFIDATIELQMADDLRWVGIFSIELVGQK
jgi:hypothetical protein